mgnify:CR=1 FL=1
MALATAIQGRVWEDGSFALMARIVGHAAAAIVQADITTIERGVWNLTDDVAVEAFASIGAVSGFVYNTLQTDARWTVDTTGYNFRQDCLDTLLTKGEVTSESPDRTETLYRVEYRFTPASGGKFMVVYHLTTGGIYSS